MRMGHSNTCIFVKNCDKSEVYRVPNFKTKNRFNCLNFVDRYAQQAMQILNICQKISIFASSVHAADRYE